jgi:hypothetical protein
VDFILILAAKVPYETNPVADGASNASLPAIRRGADSARTHSQNRESSENLCLRRILSPQRTLREHTDSEQQHDQSLHGEAPFSVCDFFVFPPRLAATFLLECKLVTGISSKEIPYVK